MLVTGIKKSDVVVQYRVRKISMSNEGRDKGSYAQNFLLRLA